MVLHGFYQIQQS